MGIAAGSPVGAAVPIAVGSAVGEAKSPSVGTFDGCFPGSFDGSLVGAFGSSVCCVGDTDGTTVAGPVAGGSRGAMIAFNCNGTKNSPAEFSAFTMSIVPTIASVGFPVNEPSAELNLTHLGTGCTPGFTFVISDQTSSFPPLRTGVTTVCLPTTKSRLF